MPVTATGSLMDGSLDTILARAATAIGNPSPAQTEVLDKLRDLQSRLDEGLLRVAVLGQFKRGKSTLLNALLGVTVLPTGITPVTAVPTFIKAGPRLAARIAFKNGRAPVLTEGGADVASTVEQYTSEDRNPRNRLNVERVEIDAPSNFLANGIVLIDTPGVGSTFLHNTQAAEAVLPECDAAVMVLSPDPPITEVEVGFLGRIQKLIPKLIFVLNKIDLLDEHERHTAEAFLARVLSEQDQLSKPVQIFPLSARTALQAKQERDRPALSDSGLQRLEDVLSGDIVRRKRSILETTGRLRATALIQDLLFQTELALEALRLPQQELQQKIATFETAVGEFDKEQESLADFVSVDRSRLLKELEAATEELWREARNLVRESDLKTTASSAISQARASIGATLASYFDRALGQFTETFRDKLNERLSAHQRRAAALLNLVRQTAADLMEIAVQLPESEQAFEVRSEPYWAAPEPSLSLSGASAGALTALLPRDVRQRRLHRQLVAEAERAVLRNVANLEWALRQNVEDAFRRFQSSLSEQLHAAVQATREALQTANRHREATGEEVRAHEQELTASVQLFSNLLSELQSAI